MNEGFFFYNDILCTHSLHHDIVSWVQDPAFLWKYSRRIFRYIDIYSIPQRRKWSTCLIVFLGILLVCSWVNFLMIRVNLSLNGYFFPFSLSVAGDYIPSALDGSPVSRPLGYGISRICIKYRLRCIRFSRTTWDRVCPEFIYKVCSWNMDTCFWHICMAELRCGTIFPYTALSI